MGAPTGNLDPLDYPWTNAAEPAVDLPIDGRTCVLAVGSNAASAVLRRKFELAGVDAEAPSSGCVVVGIAVGHSAHLNTAGYIPAAPFAAPNMRTVLRAGWFSAAQLDALDRTEPNYERVTLSSSEYPITLELGAAPAHFDIYRTRRGVLAVNGTPLRLTGQRELRTMLADAGVADLEALHSWRTEDGLALPDAI